MHPKEMASEDVVRILQQLELSLRRRCPIRTRFQESFSFMEFYTPLLPSINRMLIFVSKFT